jgi:hypothetical protein
MALVRTYVSEERIAPIIRVIRIGKLGTALGWKFYVPPKYRLLQETHNVTSQKTAFFIVIAVETSNLT